MEEEQKKERPHGCLTAAALFIILSIVSTAGLVWLFTLEPQLTPGVSLLLVDIGRAAAYGGLLIVPFGLAVYFLRDDRFTLWRGVALALVITGGHALLRGVMLGIDRSLTYPGIPDLIPPLVSLVFATAIIVIGRERLLGRPNLPLVGAGAALGILLSTVWARVGVLGLPSEFIVAGAEALAFGLVGALITAAVFWYEPERLDANPFWMTVVGGVVFAATQYSLMAVRGWWVQGNLIAYTTLFWGIAATALLTTGKLRRSWWGAAALLTTAYLLPLALTDGLDGDFMFDTLGVLWAIGLGIGLGVSTLIAMVMLAIVKPLRRVPLWAAGGLSVVALATFFAVYLFGGQPGFQPTLFIAVMTEQADTAFARDIDGREERVSAVYEELTTHAETTQAELRGFLEQRGAPHTPYYIVNSIEVQGGALLRLQINQRGDVARTLDSPRPRPIPEWYSAPDPGPADSKPDIAWGVDYIEADRVWAEMDVTGEGIIVGNADSGVDWTHPVLQPGYLGAEGDHNHTWFDPWFGTNSPIDENGHGTHTNGSTLGRDGIGVAPGAQWIACRNLGRNLGNPAYYMGCMQFLFAPHPLEGDPFTEGDPLRGAHLTNNSWGCPAQEGCDNQTLIIGVEHLTNAGQAFVVSAGNSGPTCDSLDSPPGTVDAGFSVAAISSSGQITSFSSRGPFGDAAVPDVAAPGGSVPSSVPGGGYDTFSGTSMAGPHVAGLIALMWSANPDLIGDIAATEQILFETADFVTSDGVCGSPTGDDYNYVYGYGIVNAYQAVEMALNMR